MSPLLCFGVVERTGCYIEGASLRTHRPEGNHGEDCKECYYYLDSSPTHSYLKALYKYPQRAFPYNQLVEESGWRGLKLPEYELIDTGVFAENRYFDVTAEYAKQNPNDVHLRITVENRASESASIVVLPCLWFRNTWTWGLSHEGSSRKPRIWRDTTGNIRTEHESLEPMYFFYEKTGEVLFTENETNFQRLYGSKNPSPYVKDAFHDYVILGRAHACNRNPTGTKMAPVYRLQLGPAQSRTIYLRLVSVADWDSKPGADPGIFDLRRSETDNFYSEIAGALEELFLREWYMHPNGQIPAYEFAFTLASL